MKQLSAYKVSIRLDRRSPFDVAKDPCAVPNCPFMIHRLGVPQINMVAEDDEKILAILMRACVRAALRSRAKSER